MSNNKNLVYFTIGVNEEYVSLLELCLTSLRYFAKTPFDVLIMCDKDYMKYVSHLGATTIFLTDENKTPMQTSMRKVEIFQYPNIYAYDKVIYLDCDILLCDDIGKVFADITKHDMLYTFPEEVRNPHESIFFGLQNYTKEELADLKDRGVKGFNCGQFGFRVSPEMEKHFEYVQGAILDAIEKDVPYFYEQSFMNVYFNKRTELRDDSVFSKVTNLNPWYELIREGTIIAHFASASVPWKKKLQFMRKHYNMIVV